MNDHVVLRAVARALIPFMVLFGFYVIMYGEAGPGGGFQGGVILAAAFILNTLVFGKDATLRALPEKLTDALCCIGVLIYAGVGVYAWLKGGAFLGYSVLLPDPAKGQLIGIILVEIGVGITVASVMLTLFHALYKE